jgi:DNA-binding NtrC family response regulator
VADKSHKTIQPEPNPHDLAIYNGIKDIPRRILIADDNAKALEQMQHLLQDMGQLVVDTAREGNEALNLLTNPDRNYSIFITDLKMPGRDGMELIQEIRKRAIPVTVIVMTGFGSVEEAVQSMQLGAYDFLTKPIDTEHLQLVVDRALRERSLQDEVLQLRKQLQNRYSFQNIISKSPRMLSLFELIKNVAYTTTTVLIQGATGTGKEMVAQAIHQVSSDTRDGPFVAVNCAALPENLLESELFGHEKGAFTGAIGQRVGRFEMADHGTLFLDEIGEISPNIQAKLLRVLQERKFERVGGNKSIDVDFRLIAATNRPLSRLVKKGIFREDLFYRVNVVRIDLPLLRERPEDIPLLATHFAAKYTPAEEKPKKISPGVMEIFLNYPWPGNVRQLENVMERVCVISQSDEILVEHLPTELTEPRQVKSSFPVNLNTPLPQLLQEMTMSLERQYIEKALRKTKGNVSKCAKLCGMSRRSITAKISDYAIDKKTFQDGE